MKKSLIIDLMGTLLDAICVTNPNNSKEYQSKLKASCRKLNILLEKKKEYYESWKFGKIEKNSKK